MLFTYPSREGFGVLLLVAEGAGLGLGTRLVPGGQIRLKRKLTELAERNRNSVSDNRSCVLLTLHRSRSPA
jgi:hypothetical protein